MYGLPDQTQAQFLDSVTQCLTLNPQHLSCYGLKLEPATPMGRENPVLPDDDTQADTYLAMCRLLCRNGFEHYEISNFAKPGFVPGIISNTGIFPTISDWDRRPFFPEWPPVRICPGYQGLYQR